MQRVSHGNTDTKLVESLKKGDLKAFNDLFAKYYKKLYYFAKGYLHSYPSGQPRLSMLMDSG